MSMKKESNPLTVSMETEMVTGDILRCPCINKGGSCTVRQKHTEQGSAVGCSLQLVM